MTETLASKIAQLADRVFESGDMNLYEAIRDGFRAGRLLGEILSGYEWRQNGLHQGMTIKDLAAKLS